ncbi:hypothetical protein NM688_g6457 [Phlebia brevispora]|uniref:Uncharacterized protein n=1 Tax=Phlebia brevispora TaxID=194682 RepID=A0ACC1SFU2_9APHY|nr:hypothetical protein NM688_g6457 [Phlebia brevispora]
MLIRSYAIKMPNMHIVTSVKTRIYIRASGGGSASYRLDSGSMMRSQGHQAARARYLESHRPDHAERDLVRSLQKRMSAERVESFKLARVCSYAVSGLFQMSSGKWLVLIEDP